jgi:hypothetical protein
MKNSEKYQNDINLLQRVRSMLCYGYLGEIEVVEKMGLSEEEKRKLKEEKDETFNVALEVITDKINELLDKSNQIEGNDR